ncbi:MAG TPA: hypothetical protein PLK17_05205, partial [Bacteroidales bacterium]|nr:hypothetical protein [Bacteroidales bacterium]HPE23338.1 hypothetical protein [Bacteroidales bacterium]HPJ04897.1 hypothetical protein [Bacteroidales bacterium]HPQ63962.1 hypothetical protein [Bacteroidales bacterium]HRW27527.1 hypothetical protein [Bacteroidales bacterium]
FMSDDIHSSSVARQIKDPLLQQLINSVVIFAQVKKRGTISSFISLFLIMLTLSGSFGFTLIHHTCLHCGTDETIPVLAVNNDNGSCCCHGTTGPDHRHSQGDLVLSDDCCTHEAERVVTDELVRAESQNEIIPYFLAATVIAVLDCHHITNHRSFAGEKPSHLGRDLTTLLCRIQS